MKKIVSRISLKYTYDPKGHKGAPYFIEGVDGWKNHGDLIEILTKSALGFNPRKDGNTAFDQGDDIPELNASVKSPRFTLTSAKLGTDFDTIYREYFRRRYSNLWIYSSIVGDELVMYFMREAEFKEFVSTWCTLTERQVIRCRNSQVSILSWLEKKL